jgi:prepilin-type N-terminal cleavage/methylation domain-containing protein
MIRHGFTLIEFMTAVAIILVVMAISIPVFTSARRSAQVTSSVQMLRQLHLSAKLYQSDYQGDGVYGDLPEMGLPSAYHLELLSPTQSIYLYSPCGQNLDWISEPLAFDYIYRPGEGGQRFAETSRLSVRICCYSTMSIATIRAFRFATQMFNTSVLASC